LQAWLLIFISFGAIPLLKKASLNIVAAFFVFTGKLKNSLWFVDEHN